MGYPVHFGVLAALLLGANAGEATLSLEKVAVTPLEKVVTLLEDLKAEVTKDGTDEAAVYEKFACWCKDTTATKSQSIITGTDSIEQLSTEIESKTAEKEIKETEVQKWKAEKEATTKELEDAEAIYAQKKFEYDTANANLTKGIFGLTEAKRVMEKQKEAIASYTGLVQLRKTVSDSLALASAMNLVSAPKSKAISAFLQQKVDPEDPEYEFHSGDIVSILTDLLKQFTDEKTELDTEWGETTQAHKELTDGLKGKIETLKGQIETGEARIGELESEIATAKESLVEAQSLLKEDQLYMKDMTKQCEVTAKDYDQQSKMRADELTAITTALEILKNKVTPAEVVNKRALLQAKPATIKVASKVQQVAKRHSPSAAAPKVVSFVQTQRTNTFLEARSSSAEERKGKAVAVLQHASKRLNSPFLSTLAMQVAKDPFKKVKDLIEKLIVRLVAEATAEATKKGYCDKSLGEARLARDYNLAEAHKKNVEAAALEVKIDALNAEITELNGTKIPEMEKALSDATTARKSEKETNLETIATATDGLKAIKEAIVVLKDFYKQAKKATVLLQKVSPIEEAMKDMPVMEGAYKGKQTASVYIITLLEQIRDDFDRTIRTTTASEKQAAADFVLFERNAKSSLSAWKTKVALDVQDLKAAETDLEQTMSEMKAAMDMLDDQLQILEQLKPTCIDSGMSYADRVAKREEEVKALKSALCALDEDKVEDECK